MPITRPYANYANYFLANRIKNPKKEALEGRKGRNRYKE